MAFVFDIQEGGHDWEKKNLITQRDNKTMYDLWECKKCGVKGKVRNFKQIEIDVKEKDLDKARTCPHYVKPPYDTIQIVYCNAVGGRFAKCIKGSVHTVIEPPAPYNNDAKGCWIMGVGEPVKLLNDEFKILM